MINPQPVDQNRTPYSSSSTTPIQSPTIPATKPKKRRFTWKKALGAVIVFVFVFSGTYAFAQYHTIGKITSSSFSNGQGITLSSITQSKNIQLAGESSDRTNIMVYGLTADGLRTDTMLLVSYYWKENKVVTLNIPRDLWTNYDGYSGKIVSLYAIAKQAEPNNKSYPAEFVSNFISKEYNIPINYWIVADFNGLVQVVNSVGGIDVNNPTAFTDYEYPNADYTGYIRPAPSFAAGELHLNGAEALIFSRSRHSTAPGEGTDFARSARQMQVIKAVLTKLKAQGSLTNVSQMNNYLQIFGQNIYTSFSPAELISFASTISKINLTTNYLTNDWSETSGFICSATIDGQDALEYGTADDCNAVTGVDSQSPYRLEALTYVQNLLANGQPSS